MSLLWALLQEMLLAAVPALGFAMVFNVPLRALRYCALLGAIGRGSRMLMMHGGMNIEWASLLAAILIGIIGIYWSRWLLAHPKVFTVAAVIPMFPGHQLPQGQFHRRRVVDRPVAAGPVAVPQTPRRVKFPDGRSLVIRYADKSYLIYSSCLISLSTALRPLRIVSPILLPTQG